MCRLRFVTGSTDARQPIRLQYTCLAGSCFDTCSPFRRYVRERCGVAAAEIMFARSFSSPQLVFQTLKNCNFLFKVTQPFSSHSLPSSSYTSPLCPPPSLSRWVQSRTILSTHKICLLIFASWHVSSTAFQEGDLWETLSPT